MSRAFVRILIGDRDPANQKYKDPEIDLVGLQTGGNDYLTAALLAEGLAARYAETQDLSLDGFSISAGKQADNYRNLATMLRGLASQTGGGGLAALGASVSGISQGAMDAVDADPDRVPSQFVIGQNDFTGGPDLTPVRRGTA